MESLTIGLLLDKAARSYPERVALIHRDRQWTFAELNCSANKLARGLMRRSRINRGDWVAIVLPNFPEFVISYMALHKLGAVPVPLNPLLSHFELATILKECKPRLVVSFSALLPRLLLLRGQCPSIEQIVAVGSRKDPGVISFESLTGGRSGGDLSRDERVGGDPGPDDLAVCLYTSGTTGIPKGVLLTHRNLLSNVESLYALKPWHPPERFLCVLPLFHGFPATVSMLLPVCAGASVVLLSRFAPGKVLELIERHKVTIFAGVPSMFALLAHSRKVERYDHSSCRLWISGGAPLPVSVLEEFEDRFRTTLYEGYGPVECSPVLTVNPIGGRRKPGSVGIPIPNVEIKIVDDADREVSQGELGEIVARGPNVMLGYHQRPEETGEALRGGWYHTGDIGRKDEDGYLYIEDRKKDLIIVKGENVYPREIEEVLSAHPAIADAAAVGVRDGLRGEIVRAVIVLRRAGDLTDRQVVQYCDSRLARFKVPKEVIFVDQLPRTATGKVEKEALREMSVRDAISSREGEAQAESTSLVSEDAAQVDEAGWGHVAKPPSKVVTETDRVTPEERAISTHVLLSGNAAVARGAFEAGITFATGYPGTPSTEIIEAFARYPDVYAEWSSNEKVALEVSAGASMMGRRCLVTMKHVGLNVASDAFFALTYMRLQSALVIAVADDPGMHSSQSEQDSRHYAKSAMVPLVEPSDPDEARRFVHEAVKLSELYQTPVLLRLTTRVAHTRAPVQLEERSQIRRVTARGDGGGVEHPLPLDHPMVESHADHLRRMERLATTVDTLPLHSLELRDRRRGIVTSGVAYYYVREVLPDVSVLKLGITFPFAGRLVRRFARQVDTLYVVEELDPFLEDAVRACGIAVRGKDLVPSTGELGPDVLRRAFGQRRPGRSRSISPPPVPFRFPGFCAGCPYRGVFYLLSKLELFVTGDIGCYLMGICPPVSALHTLSCMGSSINYACGIERARERRGGKRIIAVIGDSTLLHAGLPALVNMAHNLHCATVLILDNGTTAMTGLQSHPGSGETLQHQSTRRIDLEAVVGALGIRDVAVSDPYDLAKMRRSLEWATELDAPSVVIARRDCIYVARRSKKKTELPYRVDPERCTQCGECSTLSCPALVREEEYPVINPIRCTGCSICAQVCPQECISQELYRRLLAKFKTGAARDKKVGSERGQGG